MGARRRSRRSGRGARQAQLSGRPARQLCWQIGQGLELLCRQRAARDDRGTVLTEDVRHTEPRSPGRAYPRRAVVGVVLACGVDAGYRASCTGRPASCTNRSSGLCTLLTWFACTAT